MEIIYYSSHRCTSLTNFSHYCSKYRYLHYYDIYSLIFLLSFYVKFYIYIFIKEEKSILKIHKTLFLDFNLLLYFYSNKYK